LENQKVKSNGSQSFDWKSRKARFVSKAKDSELVEVIEKIKTLIT
jgi:hypothetical protein